MVSSRTKAPKGTTQQGRLAAPRNRPRTRPRTRVPRRRFNLKPTWELRAEGGKSQGSKKPLSDAEVLREGCGAQS